MSHFTPQELAYLQSQRLGRLATVTPDGFPNVVPVTFRYNADMGTLDIGGFNLGKSQKFKNIQANGRVAFVIDDVLPPWEARGIEVRGTAEALAEGGSVGDGAMIRITPKRIISWGIDSQAYVRNSRNVE